MFNFNLTQMSYKFCLINFKRTYIKSNVKICIISNTLNINLKFFFDIPPNAIKGFLDNFDRDLNLYNPK